MRVSKCFCICMYVCMYVDCSSAFAGAVASFITNPLDLAKLRYQVCKIVILKMSKCMFWLTEDDISNRLRWALLVLMPHSSVCGARCRRCMGSRAGEDCIEVLGPEVSYCMSSYWQVLLTASNSWIVSLVLFPLSPAVCPCHMQRFWPSCWLVLSLLWPRTHTHTDAQLHRYLPTRWSALPYSEHRSCDGFVRRVQTILGQSDLSPSSTPHPITFIFVGYLCPQW